MRDPERIFEPKPNETAGLGLFDPVALAMDALGAKPTPEAPAAMGGAGQSARADARRTTRHTVEDAYRIIAQSLEGHGPQTRKELEKSCGMPVNTINARVAEMRDFRKDALTQYYAWWAVTDGRRDKQGIVHLARLMNPPVPITAAPLLEAE